MNRIHLPDFNLSATLLGGQSFSWDYKEEPDRKPYYIGRLIDRIVILEPDGEYINWQTYPERDGEEFMLNYLRRDVDYQNILRVISDDNHVADAISCFPNLRLLRQGPILGTLSFVTSSNRNIPMIRKSYRLLADTFGLSVETDRGMFHSFPSAPVLADTDIGDLAHCKLGFRARYLKDAAGFIVRNPDIFTESHNLHREDLRSGLMAITGVGEKVADCILAYGYGYDDVFPMDVWGKRILTGLYGVPETSGYDDMRTFVSGRFNGFASWAGQFLYESARNG